MKFIKIKKDKFISIDFQDKNKELTKITQNKYNIFNIQLSNFIKLLYSENIKNDKLFTNMKSPFIVGINGSVSSGKSYFAEELYNILRKTNNNLKIGFISTDNFLHSNKILTNKNIFDKKGFTESYNWKLLFKILKQIKQNKSIEFPYYSQDLSDIHPTKKLKLKSNLDILIIEGINILKPTCIFQTQNLCENILLSDYIDFSIYIQTSEKNLKDWFHKRLLKKKTLWKKNKIKQDLTKKNKKEFKHFSNDIWNKYNKPNLINNINPFRYRSDIIIHKKHNHDIDYLELKI